MARRLAVVVAALLMATGGLVSAPRPTEAVYSSSCGQGTLGTYQKYHYRSQTASGVYGQAVIRNLHPCDTDTVAASMTQIWPADLQGSGGIVQLGFAECSPTTVQVYVSCFGHSADSNPWFVYTPSDATGGDIQAFTYLQNGRPIQGHTYGFYILRIYDSDESQYKWRYCLTDFSTSPDQQACHDTSSHWASGNLVWYGGEVHDTADEMGVNSGASGTSVSDMEYYSGGWSASLTGSGQCNGSVPSSGMPSYYHCLWGPSTVLDPYTTNH